MIKVEELYTGIGGESQIPELIVIHAMGEFVNLDEVYKDIKKGIYHAHKWLQLDGKSAHFLLKPDGSFIKQRSTKEVCWHAKGFNTNSIGIEVLVEGKYNYSDFLTKIKTDWVKDVQYKSLIELCKELINFYKIKNIKRHSDLSPERKQDPGSGFKFDWFLGELRK